MCVGGVDLGMCRYKDALCMGSQAIASVYEAAAGCDGCDGCRHILLKNYIITVSDAKYGQEAVRSLVLPHTGVH